MYSLRLENEYGNIINLNDELNYVVKEITGLNPPKAEIFKSKSPNRKGVKYNGSTLNERYINISIKLLGDIEANRNALYDYIDTERYVKIYYQNGIKNVFIEGHIEECNFELFTIDETINLAILCEEPHFKDLKAIAVDIANLLNQFTFPFAIDKQGVPISTIRSTNETNIFNSGDDVGARFILEFSNQVVNPVIYNANDRTKMISLNKMFNAGEYVVIDTAKSPKTIVLYKTDGSTENILKYANNITWFEIKKGFNKFGLTASSGLEYINLKIEYRNQYLGV